VPITQWVFLRILKRFFQKSVFYLRVAGAEEQAYFVNVLVHPQVEQLAFLSSGSNPILVLQTGHLEDISFPVSGNNEVITRWEERALMSLLRGFGEIDSGTHGKICEVIKERNDIVHELDYPDSIDASKLRGIIRKLSIA